MNVLHLGKALREFRATTDLEGDEGGPIGTQA